MSQKSSLICCIKSEAKLRLIATLNKINVLFQDVLRRKACKSFNQRKLMHEVLIIYHYF